MADQAETTLGKSVRHGAALVVDIATAAPGDAAADSRMEDLREALLEGVRQRHGMVIQSKGAHVLAVFCRAQHAAGDAAEAAAVGPASRCRRRPGALLRPALRPDRISAVARPQRRTRPGGELCPGAQQVHARRARQYFPMSRGNRHALLPPKLRGRTRIHGRHLLQDVGELEIHALEWNEQLTLRSRACRRRRRAPARWKSRHGDRALRLATNAAPLMIGRSASDCGLVVEDRREVAPGVAATRPDPPARQPLGLQGPQPETAPGCATAAPGHEQLLAERGSQLAASEAGSAWGGISAAAGRAASPSNSAPRMRLTAPPGPQGSQARD